MKVTLMYVWGLLTNIASNLFSSSFYVKVANDAREYVATSGVPYVEDIATKCPVTYNCTAFLEDLEKNVVGQSVATKFIADTLHAHWFTPVQFGIPLSFNFYGMSGTGKSHVAEVIIDNMLEYGTRSPYFFYMSGFEFNPDDQWKLKKKIISIASRCPRSIFLFEDIELFPENVGSYLKDIISRPSKLYGWGQNVIKDVTHEIFEEGLTRNEYFAKEFNEDKSFLDYTTALLRNNFEFQTAFEKHVILEKVLHHVPFLPMDADVVRKCIERIANTTDTQFIKRVMRHVDFTDDVIPISTHGCKLIGPIVAQVKGLRRMIN